MNEYQKKLYDDLMHLCASNEAFYYVDQEMNGDKLRIFLYRLASYSDFCLPNALESRGTMFRMNDNVPEDLVCHTFEKFFNISENPSTMDLDFSDPVYISEKRDGSLISSYTNSYGELRLKTKGSLHSVQAIAAFDLLSTPAYSKLKDWILQMNSSFCTVNLEYTSTIDNRIVLSYEKPELTILGVRNRLDGSYLPLNGIRDMMPEYTVTDFTDQYKDDMDSFIASVPDMKGIEGFVIKTRTHQLVKYKTNEYFTLHKLISGISNSKHLYEAVVMEAIDDVKSMFSTDPIIMNRIDMMETHVRKHYNHVGATVDSLYEENKTLDRKSFAIKMLSLVDRSIFGLLMNRYQNKEINLRNFMIKNYDLYKLPEEILQDYSVEE
jgi:RNA ligase